MVSPVENLLEPLKRHLSDQKAIEIVCRTPGEIGVEARNGKWKTHQIPELDDDYWNRLAKGLAIITGQRFSAKKPVMRGTLPGGHRLFLMTGPNIIDFATRGPGVVATIRLNRTIATEIHQFGADNHATDILKNGVLGRKNIVVAGSMGSGKTSLTRILCDWISEARPVSIEDSAEIELKQPFATQFLVSAVEADTEITNRDIVSNLQRTRADRFILGETTIENVSILMRLYNLGVPGTLATLHCDTPAEAIDSISELLNLSGYTKNEAATRKYLERKIDMVVFVERAGASRVISEIYKPLPGGPGEILWRRG